MNRKYYIICLIILSALTRGAHPTAETLLPILLMSIVASTFLVTLRLINTGLTSGKAVAIAIANLVVIFLACQFHPFGVMAGIPLGLYCLFKPSAEK